MYICRIRTVLAIWVVVAVSSMSALGQVVTIVASSSEGTFSAQYGPIGTAATTSLSDLTGTEGPLDLDGVGTLEDLSVSFNEAQSAELGFAFTAGDADTTFSVSTGTMSFPAILNPFGQATGTLTLTSNDGGSVTGTFSGDKAMAARGGGDDFALLLDPLSLPGFGSDSASAISSGPISGSISNIEVEFKVDVTANELIAGTGKFEVVPEPASLVFVALGGLAMLRRRR